ncbi:sulfite exporter TauE/SafE family protein [Sporosarcina limicola]|uniref:Probable membrane transporter protein n=1 Tax=Sporosarcina limicola TaxID=34101 RepID=A0A927R5N3_9BACL|nr:sulfite exporter TauE/SafE family protein [Sporosarcina limicola]MBE1556248.1 putative membrane protein YfcA [Sporosarcina limicola]
MEYIMLYFIGFAATILGTLAGGGGLISLPAMLLMGLPVHSAIGANKVSNTVSSLSSFLVIYKNKEVTVKEALTVVPISLAGGVTGGVIASFLKEEWMIVIAIVLLTFAFITSFLGKADFDGSEAFHVNKKSAASLYGIGIYDGVFGPGSGTLALYLYARMRMSYLRAVGLSRIMIFSSCFGASISYISTGKIIWPLTIALMLGSISGAQLGVRLAHKLKKEHVKPILRLVTVLLIIQIIMECIGK